ncbi:MAG: BON domain-containing protein [Lysobacter sp.]
MIHKQGDRYHQRPEHYAARNYHDMPSVTPRQWGARDAADDSFGYEGQGGYGDFRYLGRSTGQGDYAESQGRRAQSGQARGGVNERQERSYSRGVRSDEGVWAYSASHPSQRGRGPRGERSDEAIREDVCERLSDDSLLDASEILVMVEERVVTLTGEVTERWMKHRAEDLADAARGAREIVNRIRIDSGVASFGVPGEAVRSGKDQQGSGFSSSSHVPRGK